MENPMNSLMWQGPTSLRSTLHEGQLALRLHAAASELPRKIAIASGAERLSYHALDTEARRLADKLMSVGIVPGDRVALHMHNGIDLAVSYFGCFYAGAIAVPVNTRMKAPEIRYVLEHSGASLYLGQPDLLRELAAIRSSLQRVRAFIPDVRQFAAETGAPTGRPSPHVAADQAAVILYTSGTTARPKGVTHSHRTLLEAARASGIASSDVAAVMTPMAHAAGCFLLLACVDAGAMAVTCARFEADRQLDDIASQRCTFMLGMSVMYQELSAAQLAQPRDVSSLRRCLATGDAVPPALKTTFAQVFGRPLYEVFGTTELGMVAANCSRDARLRGSCGCALANVEVALADAAHDNRGATGELIVRSPSMMIGYWDDPGATAAAVKDGWLYTGDILRRDPEGHLWFEGRRKEIIVRGGSNVSPQEVEAALYEHPGVGEAGVVGAPDAFWGERLVAFVSRAPRSNVEAKELIAFVGERLAAYKIPEQIVFLGALPKRPTGKIQRRALREMLTAPEASASDIAAWKPRAELATAKP
jgi:long-chain acyl-CoA synthetase